MLLNDSQQPSWARIKQGHSSNRSCLPFKSDITGNGSLLCVSLAVNTGNTHLTLRHFTYLPFTITWKYQHHSMNNSSKVNWGHKTRLFGILISIYYIASWAVTGVVLCNFSSTCVDTSVEGQLNLRGLSPSHNVIECKNESVHGCTQHSFPHHKASKR